MRVIRPEQSGVAGCRTRIKICGITRSDDAWAAVRAGADAIGLVFYSRSPRYIDPEQAAAIAVGLPPFLSVVGLFVNATREEILHTAARCRLDHLQLHGDEPPGACRDLPGRVIKAVRVAETRDLAGLERYPVDGLLLDARSAGRYGGTGQRFDWSILDGYHPPRPLLLAGGLDPGNVAAAVRQVRPFAVDVSSGVESAPGIKDADRIARFVQQVRLADADQRPDCLSP